MAVPPTIPTSFVPKQPLDGKRRAYSGTNYLLLVSLGVFGLAVLASGFVFGYEYYLKSVKSARASELAAATAAINENTVEEFVRLRDRFISARELLNQHVTLSRFFSLLESITITNVRFTSLELSVENDVTRIEMEGVARSFNALAAQSAKFAAQKDIRRAIFSDISINQNGSVSFILTAELDPDLIRMVPPVVAPATSEEPIESEQVVGTTTVPVQPTATTSATTTP